MAKKRDDSRDSSRDDPNLPNEKSLTRRDFVKTGAAAGLGAAALLESDKTQAQGATTGAEGIEWDYEGGYRHRGRGVRGPDRGHSRQGSGCQRAGGRFQLRPWRQNAAQRVLHITRWWRPRPAPGH